MHSHFLVCILSRGHASVHSVISMFDQSFICMYGCLGVYACPRGEVHTVLQVVPPCDCNALAYTPECAVSVQPCMTAALLQFAGLTLWLLLAEHSSIVSLSHMQ